MLKVLHVVQPTTAGVAVVVRDLATTGAARGFDVTVASPNDGHLSQWCGQAGIRWQELPLARRPTVRDTRHLRPIRRLMDTHDVVHLHSSKAGAVGRMANLGGLDRKVIFSPHGWSWYTGGHLANAYRRFEKVMAKRASHIVAVSRDEAKDGREVLGPRAPLSVIENGVDVKHWSPDGAVADRTSTPLIVLVGRLSYQKGVDRAIRVLAGLEHSNARMRLVGSGNDKPSLQNLAAELGVKDRVEFIGEADPAPHLRAADAVLLLSRWEGMSLALLEAMSVGAPVIATKVGGSYVLSEATGMVVPNDDRESVTAATALLDRLLSDPGRAAEVGAVSRAAIVERYSWSRTFDQYADLYERGRLNVTDESASDF